MLSHQGRTTKDKDEIMSANHKIQRTTGGVIHSGSWAGNEAEPEPQEETPSVDDMRAEYEDLILIARGLRLLADELCRKLAEMQNSGMEKDHPRFQKTHAKLVRCLDLESANLKTRVALSEKIRETRIRNAYDREKPFHRQVKDAINLKW